MVTLGRSSAGAPQPGPAGSRWTTAAQAPLKPEACRQVLDHSRPPAHLLPNLLWVLVRLQVQLVQVGGHIRQRGHHHLLLRGGQGRQRQGGAAG